MFQVKKNSVLDISIENDKLICLVLKRNIFIPRKKNIVAKNVELLHFIYDSLCGTVSIEI